MQKEMRDKALAEKMFAKFWPVNFNGFSYKILFVFNRARHLAAFPVCDWKILQFAIHPQS
jgi:hypothetical protein